MPADLLTFDILATLSVALATLAAAGMVLSQARQQRLARAAARGRTDA
ncbi:MAG: hypothetical protein Q8S27_16235 [Hoeflea sp.]|nr:hypothetical protein [Hoeflea sp.]MDP2119494.1 hypothetical protein [Hoeflea sp.]MDP3526126.1 hypothetical protein [Hoeflea sp.]MDZ7600682.1 hypothetical protein [Hoeflea sp.]